jgi:hypothetical protein
LQEVGTRQVDQERCELFIRKARLEASARVPGSFGLRDNPLYGLATPASFLDDIEGLPDHTWLQPAFQDADGQVPVDSAQSGIDLHVAYDSREVTWTVSLVL